MRLHNRCLLIGFAAASLATLSAPDLWGYAEEQTDPSGQANASTHHLYLTRALAVCAGLDYAPGVVDPVLPSVLPHSKAKDAEIIAFNDELTDVGTICMQKGKPATGNTALSACDNPDTTWTNCTPGSIPSAAINGDKAQCSQKPTDPAVAWEVFPVVAGTPAAQGRLADGAWQPNLGCFSQRFSPWSPLFHFPETADVQRLRKFAAGEPLTAPAAYAYGPSGSNMWLGQCFVRPQGAVPTGVVKPGSLEAFGMFLHTVGDFESHLMCQRNWSGQNKPPWYFHTPGPGVLPANQLGVPNCGFNDHAFEFGCADSERRAGFLSGTVNGAERVYAELLQFAAAKGKAPRIASVQSNRQWLHRQLQRYATLYRPSVLLGQGSSVAPAEQAAAQCRVNFAWQLLKACVASASAKSDACLPDVMVGDAVCPASGQVGSCPRAPQYFPLAPACPASPKAP